MEHPKEKTTFLLPQQQTKKHLLQKLSYQKEETT